MSKEEPLSTEQLPIPEYPTAWNESKYNWAYAYCSIKYLDNVIEIKIIIKKICLTRTELKKIILEKLNISETDLISFGNLKLKYLYPQSLAINIIEDSDILLYINKHGGLLVSDNRYHDWAGSYMYYCDIALSKELLL